MRLIGTLKLVALLTLAAHVRLVAQQPTAAPPAPVKTGKAGISGVVVDSLNLRYLPGADIVIQGVDATLTTDSLGRFHIEGLPPGSYQVAVFHPLLDTLGIAVASQPFHVGPDSTSLIVLSVPPAATLISHRCPPPLVDLAGSAVIGHLNDPETLKPVAGAEVSVTWMEIEVSKEAGIRQTPHVLRDTTNAAGEFHLCRLPNSMDATLQARKATTVTSAIPISLAEEGPQLFMRTILLSRADSGTVTGNARVSGTVVLEGSPATGGSRVELVGTDVVTMTNDKGEFTMTKVPSGSHLLLARHLGYGAASVPVDLTPRAPQRVTIKLPKFVAMMDPVLVTARLSAGLEAVGFNERKKRTGSGYFFGPDQLQRMHPTYLSDILRQLPSVRVVYSNGSRVSRVTSRRGVNSMMDRSCMQYFVDDMPWSSTGDDINDFVNGNEVVAVELYQPGQAPPQYSRGLGNCLTVVLWTRFRMPDLSEK